MLSRTGWLALLTVLLMAGLILGACGGAAPVQPSAPAEAPAQEAASTEAPVQEEAAATEEAPAEEAAAEATGDTVKVALLLPGPITDGGWSQLAYEGLQALGEEEGFEVAYSENTAQADIPETTRGYADDGYNLIIGHGFEFGSAFIEIAPDYPDQFFFATTFQPQEDSPANTQYVDAAYFDAAYAAGALAAMISESKTVGFVGGGDNPTQQGMMKAFIAAAEQHEAQGLGVVTGDYNDAAKGREAATTMVGNGADVIWHAADVTGLGAIEGAVASKAKVLGCYSDQTDLAPDNMGASLVMDLGPMVQKLAYDVRDGKFAAGTEWKPTVKEMWHWSAGDSDHNAKVIPDEVWQSYLKTWDDIAAGEIDVEAALTEGAPAEAESGGAAGEPVRVALLLPGPITDGGWSQLAYEGLQALGEEEGFEVAYGENTAQADIPEVTRGYADDGYNLIVGHGFEFGSAFIEIAPDYPDQFFFATTFQPQEDIPANTQYVDAAYFDAAYAAGALAALMSESKTVGFVGGGDNPTQQGMMKAFVYAAEQAGGKGLGVVTGDYNDAAKGREAAATMIGNGADVIWHAADVTGLGAIEGAVASDAKVLGCYSDQTELAPDAMGASLVMDLSNMVQKLAHDVRDGTFAAGTEWKPTVKEMWHWSYDGGQSDHNPEVIPDAVWQENVKIWDDLAAGKIDVEAALQ